MIPLVIGIAIVVLVLLAAGVFMARKKKKSARPAANADVFRSLLNVPQQPVAGDAPEAEKLRQNLRVKLLYQEDKIDEALAFERERNPGGSMTELLRAAVERWERDNR